MYNIKKIYIFSFNSIRKASHMENGPELLFMLSSGGKTIVVVVLTILWCVEGFVLFCSPVGAV